jgi:glutamine amidotransferase
MPSIAVIDYGMGNLRSVSKALEKVTHNQSVLITSDADDILTAERVVFPGVGAIRDCMSELHRLELNDVIKEVATTRPFLGICLGMQALLTHSEESGGVDTLGLIPGQVKRFPDPHRDPVTQAPLKVPHMGWNTVEQTCDHPVWKGIESLQRFYFVHSYYAAPDSASHIAGTCCHGISFAAAVANGCLFATQFHPEKSQDDGLRLLQNFVNWDGSV